MISQHSIEDRKDKEKEKDNKKEHKEHGISNFII